MRLAHYIRPELVLTDLSADGVEEVLRRIATHLKDAGAVPDEAELEEALLARERSHTTAMGHGMALPHATLAGLDEPILALALASRPLRFGPPDTEPVRIFFVLLSPPGRESEHIKLLARICRLVRHPGFVESLHEAGSGADALRVIEQVDEQHV